MYRRTPFHAGNPCRKDAGTKPPFLRNLCKTLPGGGQQYQSTEALAPLEKETDPLSCPQHQPPGRVAATPVDWPAAR